LRKWEQQGGLKAFEQEWVKDEKKRKARREQIKNELSKADPITSGPVAKWYVNGQGQTMVVIPGPVKFRMGSPRSEAGRERGPEGNIEIQHEKRISRTFAIAAHEVTVEQYRQFRKDHEYNKHYSPTPDCPINLVTWYDAAAYCNWLSEQEGIPQEQWCYEPKKGKAMRDWSEEAYGEGMKLRANYLSLEGYRLPTEAEWEYACRAGSLTSRYYGETEELLGRYAWYTRVSKDRWMLPTGSLKPNDLGLFDMLGNALEWCGERVIYYSPGDDKEDIREIEIKQSRAMRGCSFMDQPVGVRSADRDGSLPANRDGNIGFRPARTFR
jgi:formylglycine-generating enzyme required for sulfatase activity